MGKCLEFLATAVSTGEPSRQSLGSKLTLEKNRDELEDAELEMSQVSEGMPMHMNGFKDHPM